MSKRTISLSILTLLALTLTAHAQGGAGGGAGAGGAAAGTGGTAAASSTTGGTSTTQSTTGGTAEPPGSPASGNPAAIQQSAQQTRQLEQNQQNAVTTGANTRPSTPESGTVSAPGVGVGHAANGMPIGAPGSGLGSPEHSVGPTTRH